MTTNITLPRATVEQALDALESSRVFVTTREKIKHPEGTDWYDERITALRAALAQQAEPVEEPDYWQEEARRYAGNADYWRKRYEALAEPVQEPVAWGVFEGENLHDFYTLREDAEKMAGYKGSHATVMPLYTAPRAAPPQQAEPQNTHSTECWRWHHKCAVAKIERECKHE